MMPLSLKCFTINRRLLSIKTHFFLYFGGLAGILPFLPVFARQLGISATVVGFIYTVLPFLAVCAKPLFGGLADRFRKTKVLLIILIVTTIVSHMSMLLLPSSTTSPSKVTDSSNPNLQHMQNLLLLNSSIIHPTQYTTNTNKSSCLVVGNLNCSMCCQNDADLESITTEFLNNCFENSSITSLLAQNIPNPYELGLFSNLSNFELFRCLDLNASSCSTTCEKSGKLAMDKTNIQKSEENLYLSFRFIAYLFLIVIAWISSDVSISISDAVCHEILNGCVEKYGEQRIWGTIGWGCFTTFSGYLIDVASGSQTERNYLPGFCILGVLLIIDLFILPSQVKSTKSPDNILREVKTVFKQLRTIIFLCAVFTVGILTGLQWSYTFWFLEDLGATQLLMGLVLTVQCFLGELPFMYFSGWIIEKVGHYMTMALALWAFGVRYIGYYFLWNPWWVLPIELLQGFSFGTFYSCMTSYAKVSAPPGTEGTMQGLFGAIFTGLGVAVGSLTGGLGFDSVGGRLTFLYFSILSFVTAVLMVLAEKMITKESAKEEPHFLDAL